MLHPFRLTYTEIQLMFMYLTNKATLREGDRFVFITLSLYLYLSKIR